jgi:hypothetical protein
MGLATGSIGAGLEWTTGVVVKDPRSLWTFLPSHGRYLFSAVLLGLGEGDTGNVMSFLPLFNTSFLYFCAVPMCCDLLPGFLIPCEYIFTGG